MPDKLFSVPVVLAFNPAQSSPVVQEIFADDTARTIWLAWRVRHIVNQYFNKEVIEAAARVDARKPTTAKELYKLIQPYGVISPTHSNFVGSELLEWCEQVLPYLTGQTLPYTVIPEGEHE